MSLLDNNLQTPPGLPTRAPDWRPLAFFNYYRLALSGLFVILFLSGPSPSLLGSHNHTLFLGTAVFYLAFSIFSLYSIYKRQIAFPIPERGS